MARGISLADMLGNDDEDKQARDQAAGDAQYEQAQRTADRQMADVERARQSKPAPKYRPKVSFYQDPADTDRVRGAILHTMATEGPRTLSQFIDRAVMAEVVRLEKKHNGGQPFPPVGARELPQGRPMGE